MFGSSPRGSGGERKKSLTEHKYGVKAASTIDSPRKISQVANDQQTQTNIGFGVKPKVQDDFRNLLLEFVINCLLDQPQDVVDYAADYFLNLQEHQHTVIVREYDEQKGECQELGKPSSEEFPVAVNEDAKSVESAASKEIVMENVETMDQANRPTSIETY